ncbi:MAG: DUF3006 domain-containing protein [Clostridia bacterium]|nr:DUF3006 domain-containing protein [Clostridia bacterium]
MRVIIDRIEENIAVCELEDGKMINIPRELFEDACEGDVFDVVITKNDEVKEEQTRKARSLFEKLINRENKE